MLYFEVFCEEKHKPACRVPTCHQEVRKQIPSDSASEQLDMERIKNSSRGALSALHLGKQRIPRAYMRYN